MLTTPDGGRTKALVGGDTLGFIRGAWSGYSQVSGALLSRGGAWDVPSGTRA